MRGCDHDDGQFVAELFDARVVHKVEIDIMDSIANEDVVLANRTESFLLSNPE